MTERAEDLTEEEVVVKPSLTTQEFGVVLGCLIAASERQALPKQRESYLELADKLRDAQWDMLGPMPVQKGMTIVNQILAVEKATAAQLRDS